MKIFNITAVFLFTFIFLSAGAQVKKPSVDEATPFVLGVIDNLYSKELGEKRIFNIYLPDGYDKDKDSPATYPVTYLLDGSADEDFIHVAGLYQFNSFEWINRIPKSIVVGIATVDRRRDFTFPTTIESDKKKFPTSGHSDKFLMFIEKELQPFIEKKYKANKDRTIIGQSFGGLLAAEALVKKPTLFNNYIIVSPSLWWDNGSLLKQSIEISKEVLPQNIKVYIGVGKEGLTPTEIPRVMEVDANLLAEKIKNTENKQVTVYLDYLPEENHATISHQAIFNALKWLFPIKH